MAYSFCQHVVRIEISAGRGCKIKILRVAVPFIIIPNKFIKIYLPGRY